MTAATALLSACLIHPARADESAMGPVSGFAGTSFEGSDSLLNTGGSTGVPGASASAKIDLSSLANVVKQTKDDLPIATIPESGNALELTGTPPPNQKVTVVVRKLDGGSPTPLIIPARSDANGHLSELNSPTTSIHCRFTEGPGRYQITVLYKGATKAVIVNAQNTGPAEAQATPSAVSTLELTTGTAQALPSFISSMTADPSSPTTFYGLANDPNKNTLNVMRSTDSGATWQTAGQVASASNASFPRVAVGSKTESGQDIFVASASGVFHSTGPGQPLTILPGSLPPKKPTPPHLGPEEAATDVKLSADGNHLLVGYANGRGIQRFDRVNGKWSDQPTLLGDLPGAAKNPDLRIHSIQFDPFHPEVAYAGTGHNLYRWDGTKWTHLVKLGSAAVISDDTTINSITVDKNGTLTMATCGGIFQAQVDNLRTGKPVEDANISFTKVRSASFLDQRLADGIYYHNPNYLQRNQPNPGYLRAHDVVANPENPNEMVAVSASGVYLRHKNNHGQWTWTRINNGRTSPVADTLDPSEANNPEALKATYYSAVWAKDPATNQWSVIVSGDAGTYKFPVPAENSKVATR